MADIRPFRALRPNCKTAAEVVSYPPDRYSPLELKRHLQEHPTSFLQVIHPDVADGKPTPAGSEARLKKTRKRFEAFIQSGTLQQDELPGYYIYRQIKDGQSYTGIIASIAVTDYFNGIIKTHEQTLEPRERKLQQYLEVCGFNAEPVLFAYPQLPSIQWHLNRLTQTAPETQFYDFEGVYHQIWPGFDSVVINAWQTAFQSLEAVYIADGHHRSASSARLWQSKSGSEAHPFEHYLGIFFAEEQLRIYEFNRAVKINAKQDIERLKSECQKWGNLETISAYQAPKHQGQFVWFAQNHWYCWTLSEHYRKDRLDTELLNQCILEPVFQIFDLRNDTRVSFIPGVKSLDQSLQFIRNEKADILFMLHPVTMQQLKQVALANRIMPPKSTWVEPKLLSALCVYSLF